MIKLLNSQKTIKFFKITNKKHYKQFVKKFNS